MKHILVLLVSLLFVACGSSRLPILELEPEEEKPKVVATSIDLQNVSNDKVEVTVNPPEINSNTINFYLPAIVPGTYSRDDYGNYIEGFRALDANGNTLKFEKIDANTWQISNANRLDKVTYLVNDTFDIEDEHDIFSPSGTNISTSNYVLNMNGFVGYFDSLKSIPYEVLIKRPDSLYAGTSLKELDIPVTPDSLTTANANFYKVKRYAELVDSPIMFSQSKPETFTVGETEIVINVYSPTGLYDAEDFKPVIEKMIKAQKAYLGNLKTTNRYAILLYLSTVAGNDAQGFGALEHNTSTVVVLPEQYPKPLLDKAMIDVVAHEFFHVVTPLAIHSEEIHYFDYNDPKMSEHLWLYEGVTEYFAQHFQVAEGLISEDAFYDVIITKMNNAKAYQGDFSFTEMSENILQEPYKSEYANVYEKGALIGMCIDIIMRDQSNGDRGLIDLMKALTRRFGSTSPFRDEQLIEIAALLSNPEVGQFLMQHVEQNNAINYTDIFYRVGLEFNETTANTGLFINDNIQYIKGTDDGKIAFRNGIEFNSSLTSLGVKANDVLLSFMGVDYNLDNVRDLISVSKALSSGQRIEMIVARNGEQITLSSTYLNPTYQKNILEKSPILTAKQRKVRQAWLNGGRKE